MFSPLPGLNMDPILSQASMQDYVFVQPCVMKKTWIQFVVKPLCRSLFMLSPLSGLNMDPILCQAFMQDSVLGSPLPGLNMDPILCQALTQDFVHVQPSVRTKHGSRTLNHALMQDFVHVQAFARTKHGSNFESSPYAGLCACSALCQD